MQHHPDILIHRKCRACDGHLTEVLNLGTLALNAFPAHAGEIGRIPTVPLILTVCAECGLSQLDRTVPPDWLYRDYWYRSGINEAMRAELLDIVTQARQLLGREPAKVLDIGANDGTLLSYYPAEVRCVAVEPALNLRDALRQYADEVISDYFPHQAIVGRTFDLITAIACAYDAEDPRAFFQGIHDALAPGGLAVVQFQDLEQQIRAAAFDNVCHEHLEYYSCWSLLHLCQATELTLQRVQPTPINGGSLRVTLRRVEDAVLSEPSVADQLLKESYLGLDTPRIRQGRLDAFDLFRRKIDLAREQIAATVYAARDQDTGIDVLGASTKGNIALQVLRLGPGLIRQAVDRSPDKVGRYTVTGIPIVDEATWQADPAPAALCNIWQFRETVLGRYRWYLQGGGTLIFPLPNVEIVRESWKLHEGMA